jgi:hypothetical protein
MANTDLGRDASKETRARDRNYEGESDRNSIKVMTSTETRRSFMTTEFWLTLLAAVVVVIAGYWDDANLRVNLAWSLAAGIVAAYVLSRGIAKAGSSDPHIRDI